MRPALLLLLAVLTVAAGGYALCAALGWTLRPAPLAVAAATALVAGGAAFVPLVLARGASQATVAQASLVGTAVHLLGCLAGAAGMLVVFRAGTAAAYWVLAFYWATLVVIVIEFSRAVRRAPVSAASAPPTTGAGAFPAAPEQ